MQNETGAVFQPELIELMKTVLDDAARCIPEGKRTSAMKAEIASQILACAAKGDAARKRSRSRRFPPWWIARTTPTTCRPPAGRFESARKRLATIPDQPHFEARLICGCCRRERISLTRPAHVRRE
jgi:hypothetical protein